MNQAILSEWADELARVRTVAPSAILVGGALRDLDNLGVEHVKDLDVFVTGWEANTYRIAFATGRHFKSSCGGHYIDAAQEIRATWTYTKPRAPDLNVIECTPGYNTRDMVARVDFGLCQIAYDGVNVISTDAYWRDKANRTFTLLRAETPEGVKRSLKRYERLRAKYPDYSLSIPPEFLPIVEAARQ